MTVPVCNTHSKYIILFFCFCFVLSFAFIFRLFAYFVGSFSVIRLIFFLVRFYFFLVYSVISHEFAYFSRIRLPFVFLFGKYFPNIRLFCRFFVIFPFNKIRREAVETVGSAIKLKVCVCVWCGGAAGI